MFWIPRPLSDMIYKVLNIFSCFLSCLFTFLIVTFVARKFLILMKFSFIFFFGFLCIGVICETITESKVRKIYTSVLLF